MATGFSGVVMSPNGIMPVDAYLSTIRKQKEREREKQRRGKNDYGFSDRNPDDDRYEDRPRRSHKSGGYNNSGYGGYGSSSKSGYNDSSSNYRDSYSRPSTDKYGHYGSEDKYGYSNTSSRPTSGSRDNIRSKRQRNSNFDSDDDTTGSNDQPTYTRARRRDPFENDSAPQTRQKVRFNDYSDDDDYNRGGNQRRGNYDDYDQPRGDPFAAAGGPRANKRRSDQFGSRNSNDYSDYNNNYDQRNMQPQRANNNGSFPKAKKDDLFGGGQQDEADLFGDPQQFQRGDPFGGQQQQRGDPFGGQQRGDPFGGQQRGDPFGGQQRGDPFGGQQQPRGNPFAGQQQRRPSNGFPQAKASKKDPFSKRGFNDDDDDDDAPNFNRQQRFQNAAFQQQFQQQPQQFQNQQFQQEQQFFNQNPPQSPDDLLFGTPSQPSAQSNNIDDFISLDVPQQTKPSQQKADPLAEYGDLVDLNFNKKTREHGKALGSLGSLGSLGAKGGYPRPPPVQQQQPFNGF